MKWCGNIGFAEMVETVPGVHGPVITPYKFKGDVLKVRRRTQTTDKLNDDINISNEISVVANPFINQNLYNIKYVEFMGAKWKVTDIDVQYPRIILSLGGVYNDE